MKINIEDEIFQLEDVTDAVGFRTKEGNQYYIGMVDDTIEIWTLKGMPSPRVYIGGEQVLPKEVQNIF